LRYIETIGADILLQRLNRLEHQYGARFKADPGWEYLSGFSNDKTR
jgi:hypothetical protein